MVAMVKCQRATIPLILGLVFANLVCTLGKLDCEDLPVEDCAFSVASSGTRCVLEKYRGKDDSIKYECQSSIIMAEKQEEWIESDECVKSCGLERMSVGLSTDLLMDSHFTEMLCSSECLNNCPNLIDLYISLAAGEGMYLPQLCKTHRMSSPRVIADPVKKASDAAALLPKLTSGGAMAPGGSPTPENGAATTAPGGELQRGPDYRGYVNGAIAPTPPVSGGSDTSPPVPGTTTPISPVQKAPAAAQTPSAAGTGPSTNKRPFFVASSPPTPAATSQSIPEAGAIAPETTPSIAGLAPDIAPTPFAGLAPDIAPTPFADQGSDQLSWQREYYSSEELDRSLLNDEEYLHETYFH